MGPMAMGPLIQPSVHGPSSILDLLPEREGGDSVDIAEALVQSLQYVLWKSNSCSLKADEMN